MPMPVRISCNHPFKAASVVPWAAVDKNGNVTTGVTLNGADMTAEEVKKLGRVLKRLVDEHLNVMAAAASAHYQLPEE